MICLEEKILDFKCTPERCVFNSENFKIYGCSVNSAEYPDVKISKYNTLTLKGNLAEMNIGVEYIVKAKEVVDNYGVGYVAINVKREKPSNEESTRDFLEEILTYKQTNALLSVYPDIIERIMKNKHIDVSKLHGIGEKTLKVIKSKVIENFKLADIVEEFKGIFSMSVIKKLYERYTSVDKIREAIRKDPYKCLCDLGRVGFKTADGLLCAIDNKNKELEEQGKNPALFFGYDLITSYQRANSCVVYLLSQNETEGNTYMDVRDLKKQFDILVPEAKEKLGQVLNNDKNDVLFDRKRMIVCKKKTYETETYIADRIKNALSISTKWDCDYSKYRELDGFKLTEEQCKVTEVMCNKNVALLVGSAGTGKSSSTEAFVKMLDDYKKSVLLLAPTGKAAKVLSSYTHREVKTIHRGLQFVPPDTWTYNQESKLEYDVVIVDEFSMVDVALFRHLLEAIDFNKTKLLLIGDDAQIPSVGAGNCLYDLLTSNIVPTARLTKVFRYGVGGLATVATKIRTQEQYLDKESQSSIQAFGEDKSFMFYGIRQDKLVNTVVSMYKKILDMGYTVDDIAVLSCYNKGDYGVIELNNRIQEVINPCCDKESRVKYGDIEFRLNDVVMNVVNDYKAIPYNDGRIDENDNVFIANGESGKVVDVLEDSIVVDFDGTLIYIDKSKMANLRLAYAITVHKSQGDSRKVVIMLTPKAHTFFLNSNLLYVGVTRAKEKCFQLGEISTVNSALRKKANFERKTMLKTLLTKDM